MCTKAHEKKTYIEQDFFGNISSATDLQYPAATYQLMQSAVTKVTMLLTVNVFFCLS